MYEISNDEITDLNKVYLLKNGSIEHLNSTLDVSDSDNPDLIITKIYEFGTKIILNQIIYESEFSDFNKSEFDISMLDLEFEKNNLEQSKHELEEKLLIKKHIDPLISMMTKYTNYLNINVKSEDITQVLNNFSFIKILIKKISDPTRQTLSVQNLILYDFSSKLNNIRIGPGLDPDEYNIQIEKYFDDNLNQLVINIIESYDIDKRFIPYLNVLFDILMRMYIDIHLKNKSFSLTKTISEYFNFSAFMTEPDTFSLQIKRRHWNKLLESSNTNLTSEELAKLPETKKILSSLLMLVMKKKTIDQLLKYLEILKQN